MAVAYSAQFEDLVIDTPPSRVDEDLAFGGLRLLRFTFTNPASGGLSTIGDQIYLRKVPPTCQIYVPLCYFKFSAWDTNTVLDIGWLAYTTPAGAAVAADDDGLLNDLDVDAAGWWTMGTTLTSTSTVAHNAPVVDVKEIRAREPVTITATFRTAAPTASDTLTGWLAVAVI